MPKKFSFGSHAVKALSRSNKPVNITPAMNLAGGTVNIMIFGEISSWWGVNKDDVYWALKGRNISQVNVFISSPGGEIDESFVIHDMLKGHPATTTAYLVGQCASAATLIACACDTVIMSNQCIYMIHKPMWGVWGNADALTKGAEILDKYQSIITDIYVRRTGLSADVVTDLMNAETWFEPKEALSMGFIDSVVDNIEVDFLLPTTGVDAEDSDIQIDIFTNSGAYRAAAVNFIEKGLRPIKTAEVKNICKSKKSRTMFGTEFFKNILNSLLGEKALAKGADIDDLADTLAADEDLIKDLSDVAITNAVKAEVAKAAPKALTIEALAGLVSGATAEQKETLAKALNVTPPAKEAAKKAAIPPAAKADADPDDEEGEEGEEGATNDPIDKLTKTMNAAIADIAALKKGGTVTAPTNGASSVTDKKKDAPKQGKAENAKREIVLAALKSNKITREQFKQITGEEAPVRQKS
jgi:ATP-dependent Clp protease, protease subunit